MKQNFFIMREIGNMKQIIGYEKGVDDLRVTTRFVDSEIEKGEVKNVEYRKNRWKESIRVENGDILHIYNDEMSKIVV